MRKGGSHDYSLDRRHRRSDRLSGLHAVRQAHRPQRHSVRCQAGDARPDVHGRGRLHADQPQCPVRLSLQGDRGRRAHRRADHRRQSLGMGPLPRLAGPRRQLHRLGQRLLGHHGCGAQRRQQPVGDRAPPDRAAHAHHPVRLHLLLPDAARRRVHRHPRGDPLRAPRRAVRHRHARADGAARRADDVPLEDGHHARHRARGRAYGCRHGRPVRGASTATKRARWCRVRSRRRS